MSCLKLTVCYPLLSTPQYYNGDGFIQTDILHHLLTSPLPALPLLQGVSLLREVWADGELDDGVSLT